MRVFPFLPAHTLPEAEVETSPASGTWQLALAQPGFRRGWAVLLVLLFGALLPVVPGFFHYIQQRPGTLLADPLLALLPCQDVAVPVFMLMYGTAVAAVGWLTFHPRLFLRGMWGYCILLVLRMAAIWLVPLAPPVLLVPMPDPFLAHIFHTAASEAITKDLFFSGHTSTVALLALAVRGTWWRRALALATVLIGVLVLVQHVHYSYDVLAAPPFAWLAYWLSGRLVPTGEDC